MSTKKLTKNDLRVVKDISGFDQLSREKIKSIYAKNYSVPRLSTNHEMNMEVLIGELTQQKCLTKTEDGEYVVHHQNIRKLINSSSPNWLYILAAIGVVPLLVVVPVGTYAIISSYTENQSIRVAVTFAYYIGAFLALGNITRLQNRR